MLSLGRRRRHARPRLQRALPSALPRRRRGEGAHRSLDGARRRATAACRTSCPVMAAIAESGLRNLEGDSYQGFFGMHESLNAGDYRGFPRNPDLQVKWFLDTAGLVRQRRVAEGRATPRRTRRPTAAGSPTSSGRRPRTAPATSPTSTRRRALIAGKCAPTHQRRHDRRPASKRASRRSQRPLTTGGIVIQVAAPTTTAWPARPPRSARAPSAWRHTSRRRAASPPSSPASTKNPPRPTRGAQRPSPRNRHRRGQRREHEPPATAL